MATFVHLTPESLVPRIRRNGIARRRRAVGNTPRGVFAVPVTRNFFASHHWLRELKRSHSGSIAGIYFRIPDSEQVWLGHYGQRHRPVFASEAVGIFAGAEDSLGWEIIIRRRIEPDELHRVRTLPQVLGWRFSPTSKGKPPFCACKFCTRGEYGSKGLRERLGTEEG